MCSRVQPPTCWSLVQIAMCSRLRDREDCECCPRTHRQLPGNGNQNHSRPPETQCQAWLPSTPPSCALVAGLSGSADAQSLDCAIDDMLVGGARSTRASSRKVTPSRRMISLVGVLTCKKGVSAGRMCRNQPGPGACSYLAEFCKARHVQPPLPIMVDGSC